MKNKKNLIIGVLLVATLLSSFVNVALFLNLREVSATPYELNVDISSSHNKLTLGESALLFAEVENGTAPFTYDWRFETWNVTGLLSTETGRTGNPVRYTLEESCLYINVYVTVKDSKLGTGTATLRILDPEVAVTNYFLDTPLPIADFYVGVYTNNSYFAINGTNWDNFLVSANSTYVEELVMGNVTSGTVFLSNTAWNYSLTVPANVRVIERLDATERVFINSADSQGSPYTVSTDDTYIFTQDRVGSYINSYISTDAITAIDTASDEASSILIKSGTYYLNSANGITVQANRIIEGEGYETKIVANASMTTGLFKNAYGAWGNGDANITFRNLHLIGDGYDDMGLYVRMANHVRADKCIFEDLSAGWQTYALDAIETEDVAITDSWFINCGDGIAISGVSKGTVNGVTVSGNRFDNCSYGNGHCVQLQDVKNFVVSNNVCNNSEVGIYIYNCTSGTIVGNTLYDACMSAIYYASIHLQGGCSFVTVSGNSVYYTRNPDFNVNGILAQANQTAISITGNTIVGNYFANSNVGIYTHGTNGTEIDIIQCTISNNVISGFIIGITNCYTNNSVVTGNTIYATNGLSIATAYNVTYSHNVINATYALHGGGDQCRFLYNDFGRCQNIFASGFYGTHEFIGNKGYTANSSPDSYRMITDGTYFYAFDESGSVFERDASATTLIEDAIVNGVRNFDFGAGVFDIDDIAISYDNFHFTGQGYGNFGNESATVFEISSNGGFNITSTEVLRDISFEKIFWDGYTNSAPYAITSWMGVNKRIDSLRIRDCWFDQFNNVVEGVSLYFYNLENSWIEDNTFYKTKGSHIHFDSNGYNSGNYRITGNEFYYGYDRNGENCMRFRTTSGIEESSTVGYAQIENNHYFNNAYNVTAINVTCQNGDINGINCQNDRVESGGYIKFDYTNASYHSSYCSIIGCSFVESRRANQISIYFSDRAFYNVVADNIFGLWTTNSTAIEDYSTGTTSGNIYTGNYFRGSDFYVYFGPTAYVHGNYGLESFYDVRVEGTDALRDSGNNYVTLFGSHAATQYSSMGNGSTYEVYTNDVIVALSGGTVINASVYDNDGDLFATYTSTDITFTVPYRYQFEVWYTVEPTRRLIWVP